VDEVNRLRAAGAAGEADPQAGIFARWLPGGLTTGTVRDGLAVFFAVIVELGAAFGLYLATRHGGGDLKDNRLSYETEKVNQSAHQEAEKVAEKRIASASIPREGEVNLRLVGNGEDIKKPAEKRITAEAPAEPTRLTSSPPAEPRRFVPSEKWITAPPSSRLNG
jgi:hypothetical protein